MESSPTYREILPGLRELGRVHGIGLDLIDRSHDLDELLGRILDEYEDRLGGFGDEAPGPDPSATVGPDAGGGRGLVIFATRAATLIARAAALRERDRAEKLGEVLQALRELNHEINNPLTALLGRTQLLQMNQTDPQVLKAAAVIEESASRVADLVRQLSRVIREGREKLGEKSD